MGKNISVLQKPAYSPDLLPTDFWLFPKFKETMKGKRFDITEDIISNMTQHLQEIPKEDVQKCFQQWQEHCNNCVCVCVCAGREYFEED
jgi:hypothetical protein